MLNVHGTSHGRNKRISSGHEIYVKICYISKKNWFNKLRSKNNLSLQLTHKNNERCMFKRQAQYYWVYFLHIIASGFFVTALLFHSCGKGCAQYCWIQKCRKTSVQLQIQVFTPWLWLFGVLVMHYSDSMTDYVITWDIAG